MQDPGRPVGTDLKRRNREPDPCIRIEDQLYRAGTYPGSQYARMGLEHLAPAPSLTECSSRHETLHDFDPFLSFVIGAQAQPVLDLGKVLGRKDDPHAGLSMSLLPSAHPVQDRYDARPKEPVPDRSDDTVCLVGASLVRAPLVLAPLAKAA